MLIAFLDESYDQDVYFIGAAISPTSTWDLIGQKLDAIRTRTSPQRGTPENAEFHGHDIMGGIGDWRVLRGKHREAAGVYSSMLDTCARADVAYIFRGVDVLRLHARYAHPGNPMLSCSLISWNGSMSTGPDVRSRAGSMSSRIRPDLHRLELILEILSCSCW